MQQITSAGNSSVKCLISKVLKHFNILYFLFSILDPWFNNLKRKKCFISAWIRDKYFFVLILSKLKPIALFNLITLNFFIWRGAFWEKIHFDLATEHFNITQSVNGPKACHYCEADFE